MNELLRAIHSTFPAVIEGQVHRVLGLTAESRGLFAPVGGRCEIHCRDGRMLPAEVVGFRQEHAIVAPYSDIRGISAGDRIVYQGETATVHAGPDLIGKVINADGQPLEGERDPGRGIDVELHRAPENPLRRRRVDRPMSTGVKAIDALCTVGRGQRMGIFSGSGVGKSVLLGMIARNTEADVVIIGLIGERGREVREFVETDLGAAGLSRAVVVAATSEEPALRRIQAALVATAVAEYFRDVGKDVLLLMDSLTRVATAQRELGLSCGEPPATKGYPPSVFAALPRLLERAGPAENGSITGFYTVLVEADDRNDPVADCARSILDGHLWLSRELAERGFFPAIDPLASLSRVQACVVPSDFVTAANIARSHIARYREVADLIRLGAYVPGTQPDVDASIELYPRLENFLRQEKTDRHEFRTTARQLRELVDVPSADSEAEEAL